MTQRRINQPSHILTHVPRFRVLVGEDDHGQPILDKARHTGGKAHIATAKFNQPATVKWLYVPVIVSGQGRAVVQQQGRPQFILLVLRQDLPSGQRRIPLE